MKASIERAKFPAYMIAGFYRAYRPQTLPSETFRDEGECCPASRPFRVRLIARDLFGTLRIEVRLPQGYQEKDGNPPVQWCALSPAHSLCRAV